MSFCENLWGEGLIFQLKGKELSPVCCFKSTNVVTTLLFEDTRVSSTAGLLKVSWAVFSLHKRAMHSELITTSTTSSTRPSD